MLMVRPKGWLTRARGSLIGLGVLLAVVIRSIAEILRIGDQAEGISEHNVHLIGALVAATAALFVLLLHGLGRHLLAIWLSAAVVVALFAYKIVALL